MRIHNTGLVLGTLLMAFVLLRGTAPLALGAPFGPGAEPDGGWRFGGLLAAAPADLWHRATGRSQGRDGMSPALPSDAPPQAFLTGFPGHGTPVPPSSVLMMEPSSACAGPPPSPPEVLVDLRVDRGAAPAGLATLNDAELMAETLDWLRRAKRPGAVRDLPPEVAALHPLTRVDVAVTRTGAPLHLVLQSRDGGVLWALHKAPGVRIARITVVGASASGLVDPDPGVPVRFVAVGEGSRDCPLPNADAAFAGAVGDAERSARRGADGEGDAIIRAYRSSPSLMRIGPVPDVPAKRAVYREAAGRPVLLARSDHAFAAAPPEARAAARAMQAKLIAAAAGGEIASLWPAPMGPPE